MRFGLRERQLGPTGPVYHRSYSILAIKKAPRCVEYLIVHELVHLIERHHDDRFVALMDRHLPNWRQRRREMNAAPLAHDSWSY